jgi:DNA helicase-2/ATP-dependent DNA helicase PcrA
VSPDPSRFIQEIPEDLLETIKIKVNSRAFENYSKESTYSKSFNDNVYSQDNFNDDFSQEQNYPFVKPGQKVNHMKFGHGVILSYTGEKEDLKLHINFERYGKKWLVLSYAQLEFIN